MEVRVLDMQGFDERLTLPADITASDLRELIHASFSYDVSGTSLYHAGLELPPNLPIQLKSSSTIVLFNSRIFPQKSYPKVDQAFSFLPSRFHEFAFNASLKEDVEPVPEVRRNDQGPSVIEELRRRLRDAVELEGLPIMFPSDGWAELSALYGLEGFSMEDALPTVGRTAEQRMRTGGHSREELRAMYGVPGNVELSRADFQALRRLESCGMDRQTIASVYIACDRNEAMAQNCLMSMG
jgi:hypothetical protein